MEKRTALLVTVVFGIGMFGGIIVGSIRTKSQHIKTEYFIELKHETVLIEDIDGNIITCPFDKISDALSKDNL
jgi:hypothetical protein